MTEEEVSEKQKDQFKKAWADEILKSENATLQDQLKQRDETINELKAALGEMMPIVQDVFDKITIDDTDTHRAYLKFKSALENAYKRIED